MPTTTKAEADALDEETFYTRYWGPVPIVTHVHGAVGVQDHSDGYPEAWYLPDAVLDDGVAPHGTWYEYFEGRSGMAWDAGTATFEYPNSGRAATHWYHDHTLGMTRVNVYAGPAGFFIVRGGANGDGAITDSRTGSPAVLPGPAPQRGDAPGVVHRDIPLAIQDRSFNADGSLFYPDTRAFFDATTTGFVPDDEGVPPIWNPEFFGNTIIVNGRTWPFLEVERRRYRFRTLNGCQSRFLVLDFRSIRGVSVWQIGNEGGLLAAPVDLTALNKGQLLLGPAERADLIVDFTGVAAGDYPLKNVGPDSPFGAPRWKAADPATTGAVMQFRVRPATSADPTTPPQFLTLPPVPPVPGANPTTRRLALLEHMSPTLGVPIAAHLGTVDDEGRAHARMWHDDVVVDPDAGATEVWEFYNTTMDAHPMHVHEVSFEVVDRQPITVTPGAGVEDPPTVAATGPTRPPEPWETGRKETVIAYPGEVTRVKAHFEVSGTYVWHCHIVEHEDNEMMLAYRIGPATGGEPS